MNNGSLIISFNLFLILMCGCIKSNKDIDNSYVKKENNTKINITSDNGKLSNIPEEIMTVISDPDCVEYVALWPASKIAKILGKNKKWVFLNYTVDLWDYPPLYGNGNIVGKLRASSYARIISIMGEYYKVESPIDKVHGWLNKEHIKTISKKNPKTRSLCE